MSSISPHHAAGSRVTGEGTRLRLLPVIGVLVATILAVAACDGGGHHPAAAPSAAHSASSPSTTAAGSSTPAMSPAATASASAGLAEFASARAAWNSAASAPGATRNTYLQQAADDLQASGNSSYETAINELLYLANLPVTNDTSTQQANAHSDVQALDTFFGTPGLLS